MGRAAGVGHRASGRLRDGSGERVGDRVRRHVAQEGANYPFLALKLYRMASSQAPHPHTVNPFYQYMILVVGSSLQRPPGCILPAGTKKGKFDGVSIPLRGTRRSHRRPGTPRSVRKKRGRLWRVPPRSNSGPRGRQKSWFRCLVALRTLQTPPKASLLP